MRYTYTDNGNCQIFYKHKTSLFCFMNTTNFYTFGFFECTSDGEAIGEIPPIIPLVEFPLPTDNTDTDQKFLKWIQVKTQGELKEKYHVKELTIDILKTHKEAHQYLQLHKSENVFKEGQIIDVQSLNVLIMIFDALSPERQKTFNDKLQDEYMLAKLLTKMWDLVSYKVS